MTRQKDLFTPATMLERVRPPYLDGLPGHSKARHDTEMDAATRQLREYPKRCKVAYELLKAAGDRGLTDIEGQERYFSFPKRRCDLKALGYVIDSGRRRITPRGVEAIVWVLVEGD